MLASPGQGGPGQIKAGEQRYGSAQEVPLGSVYGGFRHGRNNAQGAIPLLDSFAADNPSPDCNSVTDSQSSRFSSLVPADVFAKSVPVAQSLVAMLFGQQLHWPFAEVSEAA